MNASTAFSARTLTSLERRGFGCVHDLAHGHAQYLNQFQRSHVIDHLDRAFFQSLPSLSSAYERDMVDSFFSLGKQSYERVSPQPLLQPSASAAIDVAAKALKEIGARTIGVLSPTFDTIPKLLMRSGLHVSYVREATIFNYSEDLVESLRHLDAVFVVLPNNPTGRAMSNIEFRQLVQACASTGCVLIIDSSFRFYSDLMDWDQYAVVAECEDAEAIFVEDTGKTWFTAEVKTSIVSGTRGLDSTLRRIGDEITLHVSPLGVQLVTELIGLDIRSGVTASVDLIARNRAALHACLARSEGLVTPAVHKSTLSVEWLRLPIGVDSVKLTEWLFSKGVAVLPGTQFFDPDRRDLGSRFIRVALHRRPSEFDSSINELVHRAETFIQEVGYVP